MGDTMSSLLLGGLTSGTIELKPADVAGTTVINLPATSGTMITNGDTGSVTTAMLAGAIPNSKLANSAITIGTTTVALGGTLSGVAPTGPAFHARLGAAQGLAVNTNTKVAFNSVLFDTNTCYNVGTYRFTPSVAGYYHIHATAQFYHTALGGAYTARCQIWKNGALFLAGTEIGVPNSGQINNPQCAGLIPMNGTTDYLEVYVWTNNVRIQNLQPDGDNISYWCGFLARAL
jgi:hypothetical protein